MEISAVSNLVQQASAVPGNQVQPEEAKVEVDSTQDLQIESDSSTESTSAEGDGSVLSGETADPGHDGDVDVLA